MAAIDGTGFLATFDGSPASPQPWQPSDWAVDGNNSDMYLSGSTTPMDVMPASHGADCASPPATHQIASLPDAVYLCRDHVMTAVNAGYAVAYLTPPALLDFSQGEAILRFDLSTLRRDGRDWVDVWVTPFDEHLTLPLQDWLPPYQGEPRRGIQLRLDGSSAGNFFRANIIRGHDSQELPAAEWQGYEAWLTPDAARRDTFELRLSKTHITFGMPGYNRWWTDTSVGPALDWDKGVVQFGAHAYNPTKDCSDCIPDSWHLDNVALSPAAPMSIVPSSPRWAGATAASPTVALRAASPAGGFLRFAAVGQQVEFSTNGGATWTSAHRQPQERDKPEHFSSYLTPLPAGVSSLRFRAQNNQYGGAWMVANVSVLAPGGVSGPVPTPTSTEVPPSFSPTPVSTSTVPPSTPTLPLPSSTATSSPSTPTAASTSTPTPPSPSTPTPSPAPSATPMAPTPTPTPTSVPPPTPLATVMCERALFENGGLACVPRAQPKGEG